jgi:hypothetical protein
MVNSRFIQVHPDALVEWIWDDSFFFEDEYSIIKDSLNGVTSFAFNKQAVESENYNKIPNQLYLIDKLINKYGIADPDSKTFLQESKYVNNQPSRFDKIKIWFPLHYTFPTSTGIFLKTYALNYENGEAFNLSNFFLDVTDSNDLNKIVNESQPFRLNEKLWGKSVTIYVPSVYDESRERTNNAPTLGTINYNLTNGSLGLSQTSPVFIDFRFITNKSIILGETTYFLSPPLITSVPQAPEYNNLAVQIEQATDGDYFKINGIFNGSIGEFEIFMESLAQSGKRSYILYSITKYEENLPQTTTEIYVYQDFTKGVEDYRPVFKFANTTASIHVDMKLINAVDGSVTTKSAEIALVGNEVSKYGKYMTSINISGAIKPKLYNSKPDQLVMTPVELLNAHLQRKSSNAKEVVKYIPYPVLSTVHNVVAQDTSVTNTVTKYLGNGQLSLVLSPFDNVVKLKIAKKVRENSYDPFVIPSSNSVTQLIFKSATSELRVPLYLESNEVDLGQGVVVFKVSSTDQPQLKKIFATNKSFYVTLTTNGVETSIYDGTFTLLTEEARPVNTDTNLNKQQIVQPTSNKVDVAPQSLVSIRTNSDVLAAPTAVPQVLTISNSRDILENITKNQLSTLQLRRLM